MKYKSARRKLAVILMVAFMLGFAPFAPKTAYAAMPTSAVGSVWDGVDFNTLIAGGSGIYYGAYNHKLNSGTELSPTPILWRVVGEENIEGYLTLMSEYVLDEKVFGSGSSNVYKTSYIQGFLAGDFMQDFTLAEKSQNCMPQISVTTGKYTYGSETRDNTQQNGVDYPDTVQNQQVYLLWGTSVDSGGWQDNVFWTAGDDIQNEYALFRNATGAYRDANIARYKDDAPSTARAWWLRSPDSSDSLYALNVNTSGDVYPNRVGYTLGVRPAFKLNPTSVIFTSEIKSNPNVSLGEIAAPAGYSDAAEGGVARKFKLTVVGDNSGAAVGTLNGVPATTQYVPTGNLNLTGVTASNTGNDYTINYKIVAAGTPRAIVGYGFIPANSTSLTIDTSALTQNESYDVYVWLQKNNDINSNEGTMPTHFTLTMSAAPPSGDSYSPPFTRRTLTDTPTGVQVTAGMDMGTRLHVTANTLHPAGCKACDEIRARQAAGDVLALYDISLTGYHTGAYEVFIPFSGSGYYTVLHCNKGVLEKQSGLYTNGGVTTTWARLSPFAVVRGADIAVPDNVVVDPPKTGDAGSPWGYLMMLAGMIGLAGIVLLRRKWKITE